MAAHASGMHPIQLKTKKGSALLKKGGLKAIDCPVIEISESGCTCLISWDRVDSTAVRAWLMLTGAGQQISVILTAPPYLYRLELPSVVEQSIRESPNRHLLKFKFQKPDLEQLEKLRKTARVLSLEDERSQSGAHRRVVEETAILPKRESSRRDRSSQLLVLAEKCRGKSLAEIVLAFRKTTPEQLEAAQTAAREQQIDLHTALLRKRLVTAVDLARLWSLQSGLGLAKKEMAAAVPAELLARCDPDLMTQNGFYPLREEAEGVWVAVSRPPLPQQMLAIQEHLGRPVHYLLLPADELDGMLFTNATQVQAPPQRRRHPRFKASYPLFFQLCDSLGVTMDSRLQKGQTADISQGGIAMTALPCEAKSIRDFLLRRPWCRLALIHFPHEIRFLARICHVQELTGEGEQPNHWVFGLELMDGTAEDRERLREICAKLDNQETHPRPQT